MFPLYHDDWMQSRPLSCASDTYACETHVQLNKYADCL